MAHTVLATKVTDRDAEALIVAEDVHNRVRVLVMAPHQVLDRGRDWIGVSLTNDAALDLIRLLTDQVRVNLRNGAIINEPERSHYER